MIRYQVRSKELIDLVNEIKTKRLIMSPYFQRNLVWREVHKVDFIKTILMGLPFPQIFIAKGSIDLETMTTTSCIVDGQQRMSSIVEYVSGKLKVDGKYFKEVDPTTQEYVLKYQIPIIDLDIQNDDPIIKEIFQRLNRTFYSLNAIEKMSTEYASSDFMLFAKYLTGEIKDFEDDEELLEEDLSQDPTIPDSFYEWARKNSPSSFRRLIIEGNIFSPYEISRQVHLMYTLNLMATYIGGTYNRNDLAKRYLDEYKEEKINKEKVLEKFNKTSKTILDLKLPKKSYWFNKANMFTLFDVLSKEEINIEKSEVKDRLLRFEQNLPSEYRIYAKEGVNNRKERQTRRDFIVKLFSDDFEELFKDSLI